MQVFALLKAQIDYLHCYPGKHVVWPLCNLDIFLLFDYESFANCFPNVLTKILISISRGENTNKSEKFAVTRKILSNYLTRSWLNRINGIADGLRLILLT